MARYCSFAVGDRVRVVAGTVDELKALQKGHGGWNPRMGQYINKIGIVHRITDNRDIRVQFENSRIFLPKTLKTRSPTQNYHMTIFSPALPSQNQLVLH